jgi:hypothetical protein
MEVVPGTQESRELARRFLRCVLLRFKKRDTAPTARASSAVDFVPGTYFSDDSEPVAETPAEFVLRGPSHTSVGMHPALRHECSGCRALVCLATDRDSRVISSPVLARRWIILCGSCASTI